MGPPLALLGRLGGRLGAHLDRLASSCLVLSNPVLPCLRSHPEPSWRPSRAVSKARSRPCRGREGTRCWTGHEKAFASTAHRAKTPSETRAKECARGAVPNARRGGGLATGHRSEGGRREAVHSQGNGHGRGDWGEGAGEEEGFLGQGGREGLTPSIEGAPTAEPFPRQPSHARRVLKCPSGWNCCRSEACQKQLVVP